MMVEFFDGPQDGFSCLVKKPLSSYKFTEPLNETPSGVAIAVVHEYRFDPIATQRLGHRCFRYVK